MALFIVRFFYIGSMELAPDEAYYWDWSRNLRFGYFDHPPMAAWFIYLSTCLFGDTLRGVKFMAVFSSLIAAGCSYRLACRFVAKTSSLLLFVIIANTVVLFGVGSLIATPDIPMVLFWSLGLVFAYKAILEGSRWSWTWLGLTIGLGLLSKYIFVLFVFSLLLFLLTYKGFRRKFPWKGLSGALALAFAVFLPNLVWNSRHGWTTILFQFHHGVAGANYTHFNFLGEYLSGQAGVLSLFPFLVLVWAFASEWRAIRSDPQKGFLAFFCLVPFFFFAITSLQKRVEANWAAPAYLSGLILIPILFEKLQRANNNLKRLCIAASAAVSTAALLLIMVHAQKPFLPLSPNIDPTMQVRGWRQWARDVVSVEKNIDPAMRLPLCGNRYQETALLAFYAPGHPRTLSLNLDARENDYTLVQKGIDATANGALLVLPTEGRELPPGINAYFTRSRRVGEVYRRWNEHILDSFGIFEVEKR
jgi:undecaprenyl-diphosphatase